MGVKDIAILREEGLKNDIVKDEKGLDVVGDDDSIICMPSLKFPLFNVKQFLFVSQKVLTHCI